MSVSENGITGVRQFPKTSWSALLALRDPGSPDYARRLQGLIELYWKPVFCVILSAWTKNVAEAKDMTQAFFTEAVLEGNLLTSFVPERGSFRAFLRRSVTYFMCEVKRDAGREKRGGDLAFISLESAGEATLLVEGGQDMAPDELFDQAWNRVVLNNALELLRIRLRTEGKEAIFTLFEQYELEGQRQSVSYAEIGRAFDMTPAQVKHALAHARAGFRDAVTEVVRDYVDGPESLSREMALLFG